MNRQKRFATFLFLRRYSISKFKKPVSAESTPTRTPKVFFRCASFQIFKLLVLDVSNLLSKFFVFVNFSVFAKIFNLKVRKTGVCVVNNYADTCPGNCWLRWHNVSVVVDFADTMSAISIVVDLADTGFSQICSRKQKSSWMRFCLFIWGPGRIF